jgi:hypothetical protein
MKQRTHLDWVNEINRLQGRNHVAVRTEKERQLNERIDELEKENRQLRNELDNKKRDLKYSQGNK